MDIFSSFLHISNMTKAPPVLIPSYALYGESADSRFPDILHCETISERSRFHDWLIRPHRHADVFQFFLLEHGGGEATIEGRTFPLRAPCVILLPPVVVHGFRFEQETQGLVLTLPARLVENGLRHRPLLLERLGQHVIFNLDNDAHRLVAPLFRSIADEFAGLHDGRHEALAAQALLLVLWFARQLGSQTLSDASESPQAVVLARSFQSLIEHHLRKQWPLTRYAAELGISTTHLSRICHRVLGRSALSVVHDRLIFEARRELAYTSLTLAQIAERLGFVDPAYFTRFYVRKTGETPSAFRQNRLR